MKRIAETNCSIPTALEVMNWSYKDFSIEDFLHEAFMRAKRLEEIKQEIKH